MGNCLSASHNLKTSIPKHKEKKKKKKKDQQT